MRLKTDAADVGTDGVFAGADGAPGVVADVLPLRSVSREPGSKAGGPGQEEGQASAAAVQETDSGDGSRTGGPALDSDGIVTDAAAINGGQKRGKCTHNMKKHPNSWAKSAVAGWLGCTAGPKIGQINYPLPTVAAPDLFPTRSGFQMLQIAHTRIAALEVSNPENQEPDEGILTEQFENATQSRDEEGYWVDGGASADFFDD